MDVIRTRPVTGVPYRTGKALGGATKLKVKGHLESANISNDTDEITLFNLDNEIVYLKKQLEVLKRDNEYLTREKERIRAFFGGEDWYSAAKDLAIRFAIYKQN